VFQEVWLVGAGGVALVLLMLTVWKPAIAFYCWILLLPVQLEFMRDYIGVHFAPSDCLVPFMVIGVLADVLWRKKTFVIPRLLLPTAGLLFTFSISLFVGMEYLGYLSMYGFVNKLIGLMLLIVSYLCGIFILGRDREMFSFALNLLLISGFIVNTISLLAYVGHLAAGWESPLVTSNRISGLILDSNAMGGFLVAVFLIQLAVLRGGHVSVLRHVMWANAVLMPVGIFLTFSRSAWMALAAGILTIACLWGRRPFVSLAAGAVMIALGGMGIYELSRWWVGEDEIADLALRDSTVFSRLGFIEEGLTVWADQPVFGIGLGSYLELNQWTAMIHNTYVWLLVDTGLMGLLACGLVLLGVSRNLRAGLGYKGDLRVYAVGVTAAFVAMLTFMMGIEGLYQRHLWLLFVCSEFLARMTERQRQVIFSAGEGCARKVPTETVVSPPVSSGRGRT
jgi:O-antigen ligase